MDRIDKASEFLKYASPYLDFILNGTRMEKSAGGASDAAKKGLGYSTIALMGLLNGTLHGVREFVHPIPLGPGHRFLKETMDKAAPLEKVINWSNKTLGTNAGVEKWNWFADKMAPVVSTLGAAGAYYGSALHTFDDAPDWLRTTIRYAGVPAVMLNPKTWVMAVPTAVGSLISHSDSAHKAISSVTHKLEPYFNQDEMNKLQNDDGGLAKGIARSVVKTPVSLVKYKPAQDVLNSIRSGMS